MPETAWQGCVVRPYRDVLAAAPKATAKQMAAMLIAIHTQDRQ
jgi:hypothetical protein